MSFCRNVATARISNEAINWKQITMLDLCYKLCVSQNQYILIKLSFSMVTLYFKDQFSLLTSCLLAYILA